MGSGMAQRLLAAGFPLSVYNRNIQKTIPLAADGAQVTDTPFAAAEHADFIISMVADDTASRSIWLGKQGALSGARAGTVLIESSTVSLAWVKELAVLAAVRGCELLDAPVTGSRTQAASGELNFLVGGSASALDQARPVLSAMSRSIIHLGANGNGTLLKLINNFVCGVQAAGLAEALALIERSGIDRGQALEVLKNGAPGSPILKTLSERMTILDYTPNFLLRLMAKDLTYAIKEGQALSLDLKTAASALEVFQQAIAQGHGDKDMAAVVEPLRSL
jgi:3-hydroxyisobutyrate dehydrogenase